MTTKEAIRQLSIVGIEAALKDGHIPWGALDTEALRHLIAEARKVERYRAALTPSAETKAAFIGEFKTEGREDRRGRVDQITVSWTTTKEIMAAVKAYAESVTIDAPDTGGAR